MRSGDRVIARDLVMGDQPTTETLRRGEEEKLRRSASKAQRRMVQWDVGTRADCGSASG